MGHSLGGASLLIYAVYCGLAGRPHHLRRMVLLTPAGYHANYPSVGGSAAALLICSWGSKQHAQHVPV